MVVVAMNQADRDMLAVGAFALGGALLGYLIYSIVDNIGKYWIDQRLFLWVIVMPLGFISFALMGAGLLFIVRPVKESAKQ